MNMTGSHTKHTLERFGALALSNTKGSTITCMSGCIWLTMEGDARDIVLGAGDSFTVERDGLTVLAAHTPSVVQVRELKPTRNWWNRLIDFVDRNYGPAAIRPSRKWVY